MSLSNGLLGMWAPKLISKCYPPKKSQFTFYLLILDLNHLFFFLPCLHFSMSLYWIVKLINIEEKKQNRCKHGIK